MNDAQLLRYSRHILLPEIGIDGQNRLLSSHVLLVGAGGLGDFAIRYGYQKYNNEVTFVALLVIIIIVQLAQLLGNRLARAALHR